jgi:hypothetical protein
MPLSSTRLATALRAAFVANPTTQAIDNAALTAVCNVIATTVIAEIVANATVLPLLMTSPPGGGPVAGTGTVT